MGQRAAVKNEHSFELQRNRCESAAARRRQGSPARPPDHGQHLKLQKVFAHGASATTRDFEGSPSSSSPREGTERPRPKVWGMGNRGLGEWASKGPGQGGGKEKLGAY